MNKPGLLLILIGIIMAAGLVLSIYGSQIITEGFANVDAEVFSGDSLQVTTELDPSISETGVYVVQTQDFQEGVISAKIYDPLDNVIISKTIDVDSFEGNFEISIEGAHKLLIENSGEKETRIIGVIGYMPDSSKFAVGISGMFLIIVGFIGIIGLGIYSVKIRKK